MEFGLILLGLLVGSIVGLSGVGGGAFMTPFLIFFGIPASVAVGTDLIYAAITKSGAVWVHHTARTIQWRLVGLLLSGSLPASFIAITFLKGLEESGINYESLITSVLGVALILSSLVLIFKSKLRRSDSTKIPVFGESCYTRCTMTITVLAGALLGVLVTLSSIGAGALGAAILILLYPRLPAASIVGTDLAHAVPLAALAGAGHLHLGSVDWQLLVLLLLGSLPGVFLGSKLSTHLSEPIVRGVLASLLMTLGVGFTV
jgi:hypothetical protein